MQFAANLTLLYGKLPLEQRFAAAAADGFTAVEILFPYDRPPEWYAQQLDAHGLRLVLVNTPVADGPMRNGVAGLPGQEPMFRRMFALTLDVVRATRCPTVHLMAGLRPQGVTRDAQFATLAGNLRWAAPQAASEGVVLTLEALNGIDVPDYAYNEPSEAIDVIRTIDSPNVRLQFDLFHTAKQGLDVPAELERALPWVRHVQVAGAPQRHEPDLSRDGLLEAFAMLAQAGYDGWIGCEYLPAAEPADGLKWREPLIANGWAR